ncbi:hypothetical protein [Streptomyces xanthochromogenes]|uniref:Uncharacterized protein n=1 Tax=Streptomyces xanthochromogenes TaxID=67384 RepID=A0ABQ2ZDH6_9ACTN|nr:hypothetical protein [Streptomyces xanthochromogenes]GGY13454.1 hypothetical protein GCM10010326_00920 [Streptomyces xanthochromogenes]
MARHAKRRTFSIIPRGLVPHHPAERRERGAAWVRPLPERGFAVAGDVEPETDLLRRFLDAMRRQQAENCDGPVHTTVEAIQQTADYVLSRHLDEAHDGELGATLLTLQGHLSALAEVAEGQLDTGRLVVRKLIKQARTVADDECRPSRTSARHAAQTARALMDLLVREGCDTSVEAMEPVRV